VADRSSVVLTKNFIRIYKDVPFGAAGIRTATDLVADDEAGPGGVAYDRSRE
jgi:hypothetical protein